MKKKSFRNSIAWLLVTALVVTSFPSYVLAYSNTEDVTKQASVTEEADVKTTTENNGIKYNPDYKGTIEIVGEVTNKRGEYEKHFVNTDGSMIAVTYPEKVHYKVDGQWEDIDSRLVLKDKEKGIYGPAASIPFHGISWGIQKITPLIFLLKQKVIS
jgi:hypothetical protein